MNRPVRNPSSSQKSYSPSFTSYFNTNLAQIAERVSSEFTDVDDDSGYLIQCLEPEQHASSSNTHDQIRNQNSTDKESNNKISHKQVIVVDDDNGSDGEEESEKEFEFDLANVLPPNGDLGPVYPVFNRDLLHGSFNPPHESTDSTSKVQIQLKTLFLGQDRENPPPPPIMDASSSSSSSDSEGEELESISPRTYCVWTPNKLPTPSPSPTRCTKSNSTGSVSAASSSSAAGKAKEFRLRDLLKRSKSDGKDGVMLITPLSKQKKATAGTSGKGKAVVASGVRSSPARESYEYHYYRRGREGESGNTRRKSYLPYKQDLVGFFVTPHGLRKIQLPPFS